MTTKEENSIYKRRLNEAERIANIGSWEWDITTGDIHWSDNIFRIFGLKPQQFTPTYETFLETIHIDDRESVTDAVNNSVQNRATYSIEHRIVMPTGEVRTVHESGEVARDDRDIAVRMVGTVVDITERKAIEHELRTLSHVIEKSVNMIIITDKENNIEYVNPQFEKVTGYTKEEIIGQTPKVVAFEETKKDTYSDLWETIYAGKTWKGEFRNKKKNGLPYWVDSTISPIINENDEITHFLAVQEDITEKVLAEDKMNFLKNHDDLTGFLNKKAFTDIFNDWTVHTKKEEGVFLLVDINDLKLINEAYGHLVGDMVIKSIAALIEKNIQETDPLHFTDDKNKFFTARLVSGEFAIFLPLTSSKEAKDLANKIIKSVKSFDFPNLPSDATINIGSAIFQKDGENIENLLIKADAAAFRAKEIGLNRFHQYEKEDSTLEKVTHRLKWKGIIQKALKEDRFIPYFQKIVSVKDKSINHYESLVRLKNEKGEILLPGTFIDTAERFGLITEIDKCVIKKTMEIQAKTNVQRSPVCFAMNLSGRDLTDDTFLDFIKDTLEETGADPNCLSFEITETAAIQDIQIAVDFIKELNKCGCHFALDDFGVGFTSFHYLKLLNVKYIKIDGSFIQNLDKDGKNNDNKVFVKAMTDVARGLNIETIAEFVESEEIMDVLETFNVDFAQGYHIGKPMPIGKIMKKEFAV